MIWPRSESPYPTEINQKTAKGVKYTYFQTKKGKEVRAFEYAKLAHSCGRMCVLI